MSEIYLGNPNLKKANTQIEFTQENIQEYLKCKDNPVYFAQNYVKIVTLDHGLQPFKTYDFKKDSSTIFTRIGLTSANAKTDWQKHDCYFFSASPCRL